jgi:3-oxoacyl-(acyl-carrier-protein) synthase
MAMVRQHFAGRLAEESGESTDPTTIARPFDPQARGTILGEGGGILVLEAQEVAESRGARPYAVVAGFASSQSVGRDTVGLDLPADGEDLAHAISGALAQAEVNPADIDAIAPFGSSIAVVDRNEEAAIKRVFGAAAGAIPIITTVPNVGNCGAGNGAVGLCVAARCLRDQKLPARLNTTGAEGLDANACEAREAKLNTILVCTSSQGGQNTAVVLRKA